MLHAGATFNYYCLLLLLGGDGAAAAATDEAAAIVFVVPLLTVVGWLICRSALFLCVLKPLPSSSPSPAVVSCLVQFS